MRGPQRHLLLLLWLLHAVVVYGGVRGANKPERRLKKVPMDVFVRAFWYVVVFMILKFWRSTL